MVEITLSFTTALFFVLWVMWIILHGQQKATVVSSREHSEKAGLALAEAHHRIRELKDKHHKTIDEQEKLLADLERMKKAESDLAKLEKRYSVVEADRDKIELALSKINQVITQWMKNS